MRPVLLLILGSSMWLVLHDGSSAEAQQKKPKLDQKGLEKLAELLKTEPATLLKKFDTNGDGYLSRDELPPILQRPFEKADKNGDEKLDRQEFNAMITQMKRVLEKEGKGKDKDKPKPGTPEKPKETAKKGGEKKGPPFGPPGRSGPDFDALDRNADGRLTPDEVKGSSLADHFDEIDTNKDGQIDKKELETYVKKQAEKKGP